MTAKATRSRAEQIIAALEPEERTYCNRLFYAITDRVWTDKEIVQIAVHAECRGRTFREATEKITLGVASQLPLTANVRPVETRND